MEAYSAPVGYVFSLNAGGRSGTFDVIAGDFSTALTADTENGIYIGQADDPTALLKVAKRRVDNFANVKWFGAVGDGVTSDRLAMQAAIDATNKLVVPAGTWALDIDNNGLEINKDNFELIFHPEAILTNLAHNVEAYQMVQVYLSDNVKILNASLDGRRDLNTIGSGEHGMGIAVHSSTNVVLGNCKTKNCWGDGIYVGEFGTSLPSQYIHINNCVSDNNRRQGMSIARGQDVYCYRSTFSNTNGTLPECGVDVESNSGTSDTLGNIVLSECTFIDNTSNGIRLDERNTTLSNIKVLNCNFINDDIFISTAATGATIEDVLIQGNHFKSGHVVIGKVETLPVIDVTRVNINGNTFVDAFKPLTAGNAKEVVFDNNVAINTSYFIDLVSCDDAQITNNYIDGNSYAGQPLLLLNNVSNVFVSGNTIKNATADGIECKGANIGIDISNNYVFSNADAGITAKGDNMAVFNNHTFSNGTNGILAIGDGMFVSSNIVYLNGDHGIQCASSENINLSNNYVHSNSQSTDLDKSNIRTFQIDNSNIQGNICRIGAETNRPKNGIRLTFGNDNLVTNNDLLNSGATANFDDGDTGTITTAGNRV
jgi:parallel beta-helix repeat protein